MSYFIQEEDQRKFHLQESQGLHHWGFRVNFKSGI